MIFPPRIPIALMTLLFSCLFCAEGSPGQRQLAKEALTRLGQGDPKVRVVTASCLGSSGDEWLAGSGAQADGSILVAGTAVGVPNAIAGQAPLLIGKDGKTPPPITSGLDADGTPFAVRLSSDGAKILKVIRLPVGSGTITSAVVTPDGGFCLVGFAGANVQDIPNVTDALPGEKKSEEEKGMTSIVICKLSANLEQILWVKLAKVHTRGPMVRLVQGDLDIRTAPSIRLAQDGTLRFTWNTILGMGHTWMSWDDPISKRFWVARNSAGNGDWQAGNNDSLRISTKNGTTTADFGNLAAASWTTMYCWSQSHLRSTDFFRHLDLSAIFDTSGDEQGKIWLNAQVDGPDSALNRQPFDLRMPIGLPGLKLPLSGAALNRADHGASIRLAKTSRSPEHATNIGARGQYPIAWLMRLDADSGKVEAATAWCGLDQTTGTPQCTTIDRMAFGDGLAVVTGSCAGGLPLTPDDIGKGRTQGPYIAVFNAALDKLRYASVLPGTEAVIVRDISDMRKSSSAISLSKLPDGRTIIIAVGGANQAAKTSPKAVQSDFAGGSKDGYLTVLEVKP